MLKLIILIMMGLIVVNAVFAYDYIYSINASSQLPFSKNETLQIISETNMSFVITYSTNFTLPNITSIQLSDTNNFSLQINITIPSNYTSYGNNSINETLFVFAKGNLTNGTTFTKNITFLATISNGTRILTTGDFVQLDLNVYSTTLCNFSLPIKKFLNVSVKSKNTITIPINCNSSFLECEKELNLTTEVRITTINVSVPKGTIPGTYTQYAYFLISNTSFNNVSFIIEVIDCPSPLPQLPDDLIELCRNESNLGSQVECLERFRTFYEKLIRILKEANKTTYVNVTVEKNVTVYEPVLPAGKELTDLLLSLNKTGTNFAQTSEDYQKALEKINALENEKNLLVLQLPGLVDQSVQNAYLKNENLSRQVEGSIPKSQVYYWLKWAGAISLILLALWRKEELSPY